MAAPTYQNGSEETPLGATQQRMRKQIFDEAEKHGIKPLIAEKITYLLTHTEVVPTRFSIGKIMDKIKSQIAAGNIVDDKKLMNVAGFYLTYEHIDNGRVIQENKFSRPRAFPDSKLILSGRKLKLEIPIRNREYILEQLARINTVRQP
ncbi:MAG: hypothetical protein ABIG96_01605 [Candidatus Micrarchaeota archaeon]